MQLIDEIRVVNLFGLYSYELPKSGSLTAASILYGDNGIGKSTILRLAFHLLSAGHDRGHRTALYKVPFKSFEVKLTSGAVLRATRQRQVDEGPLHLTVLDPKGSAEAEWSFMPKSEIQASYFDSEMVVFDTDSEGRPILLTRRKKTPKSSVPSGEKAYLEALAKYVPTVFMLNADRKLDSDRVADPSDELELRKLMRYEEAKRVSDLVSRSREIALTQALSAATRWINQKALISTNQGSMNVHGVYVNVLRHLMSPGGDVAVGSNVTALQKQLESIESRSAQFAKYEFTTKISVAEFKKALSGRGAKKKELAGGLLKPYIESLEARLQAISEIYSIVDKFITVINGFLTDKSIVFRLTKGFAIQNKLGAPLGAGQLSSGEQQLLLLFCYVLTSRDMPSVFMIDEPEISLNVKWQRQLVQSLLDITEGATIQFIFASHSLELLTQHRKRVVPLIGGG